MEYTAAHGYLAMDRGCGIPELVRFEGKMMQKEAEIIGHISFDICHLPFVSEAEGLQMVNDKCQMIYDQ